MQRTGVRCIERRVPAHGGRGNRRAERRREKAEVDCAVEVCLRAGTQLRNKSPEASGWPTRRSFIPTSLADCAAMPKGPVQPPAWTGLVAAPSCPTAVTGRIAERRPRITSRAVRLTRFSLPKDGHYAREGWNDAITCLGRLDHHRLLACRSEMVWPRIAKACVSLKLRTPHLVAVDVAAPTQQPREPHPAKAELQDPTSAAITNAASRIVPMSTRKAHFCDMTRNSCLRPDDYHETSFIAICNRNSLELGWRVCR
jgi:hypothetical protein